ncbi:hypothetical protein GCM10027180_33480 [Microbulbifer echini]
MLTVDGSKLRLSLSNKLTENSNAADATVNDPLWFRNGEAKLYVPISVLSNKAKFTELHKLNISTTSDPKGISPQ